MEKRLQGVENRIQGLEDRMQSLEDRMQGLEDKMQSIISNQAEMREDIRKIDQKNESLLADQDHIWKKAVRNEREIVKIKRHLTLQ